MSRSCAIDGCEGTYEDRAVIHTVRYRGRPIVIGHVPAEVCSVCGDVLLRLDTIRRIEQLLRESTRSMATAPVYEFA